MGKATVTQNIGAGKYKIKLHDELEKVDKEIADQQAAIVKINTAIVPATAELNTKQSAYDALKTSLDVLIADLKNLQSFGTAAQISAKMAEIRAAMPALLRAEAEKNTAGRSLQMLNLQKLEAQKMIDRWQTMKDTIDTDIRDAWTVDYTDDLAVGQEVGLAEINSEPKGPVNINAGGATTPGKSVPGIGMGHDEHFTAKAMKPGWQKWQPTYRIAIILAISGDVCDVAILPATSSEQGLNINQDGIIYEAPGLAVQGWNDFAERYPSFAMVTNNADSKIPNTPALTADLKSVNDLVNSNSYKKDEQQYAKLDHWEFMDIGGAGDCEDFALTKAKMLLDKGYPASAIKIEVGKTSRGIGHAWLVVQTDGGDFALDINFKNVMPNGFLPYSDRQRQTGMDWNVSCIEIDNVPIDYMSSDGINGSVFEIDDRVVVKFIDQDWTKPVVIGFETDPRFQQDDVLFYFRTTLNTNAIINRNGVNIDFEDALKVNPTYPHHILKISDRYIITFYKADEFAVFNRRTFALIAVVPLSFPWYGIHSNADYRFDVTFESVTNYSVFYVETDATLGSLTGRVVIQQVVNGVSLADVVLGENHKCLRILNNKLICLDVPGYTATAVFEYSKTGDFIRKIDITSSVMAGRLLFDGNYYYIHGELDVPGAGFSQIIEKYNTDFEKLDSVQNYLWFANWGFDNFPLYGDWYPGSYFDAPNLYYITGVYDNYSRQDVLNGRYYFQQAPRVSPFTGYNAVYSDFSDPYLKEDTIVVDDSMPSNPVGEIYSLPQIAAHSKKRYYDD